MNSNDAGSPLESLNVVLAARRFYFDNASKSTIANELGVSRFKVARLLSSAIRDKVVTSISRRHQMLMSTYPSRLPRATASNNVSSSKISKAPRSRPTGRGSAKPAPTFSATSWKKTMCSGCPGAERFTPWSTCYPTFRPVRSSRSSAASPPPICTSTRWT